MMIIQFNLVRQLLESYVNLLIQDFTPSQGENIWALRIASDDKTKSETCSLMTGLIRKFKITQREATMLRVFLRDRTKTMKTSS